MEGVKLQKDIFGNMKVLLNKHNNIVIFHTKNKIFGVNLFITDSIYKILLLRFELRFLDNFICRNIFKV